MSNTKIIVIIVVSLVLLCLCITAVVIIFGGTIWGMTAPAADQGDIFLKALRDSDYAKAYSLCAASLQQELISPDQLKVKIESAGAKPNSWNFTSRNVDNDQATLEGTIVTNKEGKLTIILKKSGSVWLVTSFSFNFD